MEVIGRAVLCQCSQCFSRPSRQCGSSRITNIQKILRNCLFQDWIYSNHNNIVLNSRVNIWLTWISTQINFVILTPLLVNHESTAIIKYHVPKQTSTLIDPLSQHSDTSICPNIIQTVRILVSIFFIHCYSLSNLMDMHELAFSICVGFLLMSIRTFDITLYLSKKFIFVWVLQYPWQRFSLLDLGMALGTNLALVGCLASHVFRNATILLLESPDSRSPNQIAIKYTQFLVNPNVFFLRHQFITLPLCPYAVLVANCHDLDHIQAKLSNVIYASY